MTEYWKSQTLKWCEYCKTYIANNAASWSMHEQGQRHKTAVAEKLKDIRKETKRQEKEKQMTESSIKRIEEAAAQSYARDVAERKRQEELAFIREQQQAAEAAEAAEAAARAQMSSGAAQLLPGQKQLPPPLPPPGFSLSEAKEAGWVRDADSAYYFHEASEFYFDAGSRLLFSHDSGKWVSHAEAVADVKAKNAAVAAAAPSSSPGGAAAAAGASLPGPTQAQPKDKAKPAGPRVRVVGVKSSLQVANSLLKKRGASALSSSAEEAAARAAREAAKKRMEEREKKFLGLY